MRATQVLDLWEKLPVEEQREVFGRLRDKFEDNLSPGEAELIDRRLQDHLELPEDIVSLETVMAKLDAKTGQ